MYVCAKFESDNCIPSYCFRTVSLFLRGGGGGGLCTFKLQFSDMMKKTTDCAECFYYIVVIVKTPEIIQNKNKAPILYKIKQFA